MLVHIKDAHTEGADRWPSTFQWGYQSSSNSTGIHSSASVMSPFCVSCSSSTQTCQHYAPSDKDQILQWHFSALLTSCISEKFPGTQNKMYGESCSGHF